MKDQNKTKDQLIKELTELRRQNSRLQAMEQKCKTTKEALEKDRGRLLSLIDCIPIELWALDSDFRYILQNKASLKHYGDVIGKRIGDLAIPDQLKATWIEQDEKVLKGEILRQEYTVGNGDSKTTYENMVAPLFAGHTITGIVGISADISERKRIEEKLRVSEKHYRTLAEAAHDMIFIVNEDGYVEYVNSFAAAQFGLKPQDLIGKLRQDLFEPLVSERQRRNLQKVFENKSPIYVEGKVLFPGGEKWFGTWLVPIDNPAGEVRSVMGLSRDISERKKAEETLEESERKFRSLVETTSDWVWEVDRNGFYTYVSPKVRDLLGYEPEEVIGKKPFDFMPVEEGERQAKWFGEVVESRQPFSGLENTNLKKTGQPIVLETSGVPIIKLDGSFAGYRGIDRDISERKKIESILRQNQLRDEARRAELEKLLEAIPGPVCICYDPECRCIIGNRAAHDILGVPVQNPDLSVSTREEKKPGYYIRINGVAVPPEELPMQRAVSTGEVVHGQEMEVVQPDGSIRFIYGNAVPLLDENGKVRGCLGSFMDITERKRTEEALREGEQRYKNLVEQSLQGTFVVQDMRIVFSNQAFLNMAQYTAEELYSFTPEEVMNIVHPDDQKRVWDRFRERLEGKSLPLTYNVLRAFRKDDSIAWVEYDAVRINYRGRPAVQISIVDITKRREAEKALRASEQRYRQLAESARDFIFIIDREGKVRYINSSAAKEFGYDPDQMIGKSVMDLFSPDTAKRQRDHIREVIQSGHPLLNSETQVMFPTRKVWLNTSLMPLRAESGEVAEVLGIARDVTERKQAEEALRQSEEKYRHLVEGSGSVILRADKDMRITFMNEYGLRFFGYSADEIMGERALGTIIPYTDEEGYDIAGLAEDLMRHPDNYKTNVHQNICKDGRLVWMSWANKAIYDDRGDLVEVLAIGNDLTKLKEAEEALRKAHDELEIKVQERTSELSETVNMLRETEKELRIVAGQRLEAQESERKRIARELHDSVAGMLSGIKFRVESAMLQLQEGTANPELLNPLVPLIQSAIKETRRIIADLRPSALDDLGLLIAVDSHCRQFEETYPKIRVEKNIELLEEHVPNALRLPIYRIVQEALNNVGKHSNADIVKVSLKKTDATIQVIIQDNGRGFDLQQVLSKESFKRGLGLDGITERAEWSGGTCLIESSIGKGTVVRAAWPSAAIGIAT